MADGITGAAIDFAGATMDFVVPPVYAVAVPEPSILPLLAAGSVVAVAVKFMRRKK
ncbi:MAG: PEP-CTERM sorting domain-containing protein [Pseudomonadota bacterium]|nr:PEP-CTERM sorting domain-containing protein [Pseudomonadota bacterium]